MKNTHRPGHALLRSGLLNDKARRELSTELFSGSSSGFRHFCGKQLGNPAVFFKNHLDFTPLGDVVSTVTVLIQGSPDIEWRFEHHLEGGDVELDTRELREVLGDVPLDTYEVIKWIEDYLNEGYASVS